MQGGRIVMERTFDASIEDVWELWTTREGIESWWGPDGFRVEVHELDLRPGGILRYSMIAVEPDKVAFMVAHGMPVAQPAWLRYVAIVPHARLEYVHAVDFVPGVAQYDVATVVELEAGAGGVRMRLSFDPMHDEMWTSRAVSGWENELGKLAALIATRRARANTVTPRS